MDSLKDQHHRPNRDNRPSRICMLTQRDGSREAFRCGMYECQDILAEVDDVDLIEPKRGKHYQLANRVQGFWMWHDFTGRAGRTNLAFQPLELAKDYELFVAYCQNPWDLLPISAIRGWKDNCRTSVCWIDELWVATAQEYQWIWPILREFDHVVLGQQGSIQTLGELIGKQCHFIAPGVDAIRFSPYPKPPARVVDIYSIGRAWETLHQATMAAADKDNLFYVFDSLKMPDVKNYKEHREMFANMAKRSHYMYVAPAKMNLSDETKGQVEMSYRVFEASAAGAIMLGQAPDCESFRVNFDWPDAVIEIQPDGSDLSDVLSRLASTPDRLAEMSRRNAREALLRHDWSYRWKEILQIAGIKPSEKFEIRENRLKEIANLVE